MSRRDTELLVALEKQGWTLTTTGGNHLKAVPPAGLLARDSTPARKVFLSVTPGDVRSGKNSRSMLRRQGADV